MWRLELLLILVGRQEENLHGPGFVGREATLGNKMILGGWTYPAGLEAPDACVRRTVWSGGHPGRRVLLGTWVLWWGPCGCIPWPPVKRGSPSRL